MSASELGEHAGYLADRQKLAAYRAALDSLMADGAETVLDLGAGTGLLGLLAAKAGARRVYAVDDGPIIGPAASAAAASGVGDRIVHLRGRSTEIVLPERVDVVVCDQVGGFVHDAGVLGYFADARRRLLAADGSLVPAGFRLFLAPVECARIRDQIELWRSQGEGLDLSVFGELAVNTEHRVEAEHVVLLGTSVEVAAIRADHVDPIRGGGTARIDVEGRLDGLVGYFEADLGGGATLTNRPGDPQRMNRWCTLYPITHGVGVVSGDSIEVDIDVRPQADAVTWRVKVGHGAESVVDERHSTLLGTFLSAADLARSAGAPVRATVGGRAVAAALELADGTRGTDAIIAAVREQGGSEWTAELEATVRRIVQRLTTVEKGE